jgi:hypothetical protein
VFDEARHPRVEGLAPPAREAAREVVAGAGGQDGERGRRVDRAREFGAARVVERMEVAGGRGRKRAVAADDRDGLKPFGERLARAPLGLARQHRLVRLEADAGPPEHLAHRRPRPARARRRAVDDDEETLTLVHA